MVKGLLYTFGVFCLFICLFIAGFVWLFYSSTGADFAVRRLLQQTDVDIEFVRMEGTLAHGVQIQDLTLKHEAFQLTIAHLDAGVTLRNLYPLHATVFPLSVRDGRVVIPASQQTDEPINITVKLPRLSPVFDLIDLRITELLLEDFVIIQENQPEVTITEFRSALIFSERQLTIEPITLRIDDLLIAAALRLNTAEPAIAVAVNINNEDKDSVWEQVHFSSDFPSGLTEGIVRLTVDLSDMAAITLESGVSIGKDRLDFSNLKAYQSGRNGSISASGSVIVDAPVPTVVLEAQFHDLDLTEEVGIPLLVAGDLQLNYSGEKYHGHFDLGSHGSELTSLLATGSFAGDLQQLQLLDLQAQWLSAQVSGRFAMSWERELELITDLTVLELSLEPFLPQSEGQINAHLRASVVAEGEHQSGSIALELFDSVFYGYPLAGQADVEFAGANVVIKQLSLFGNGAVLEAQGDLSGGVDFHLELEEIATIYPKASGFLLAQGRLSKTSDFVAGEIKIDGSRLSYDQWQIESLQGSFALDQSQGFSLSLLGKQIQSSAEEKPVDRVFVSGAGALSAHTIDLSVSAEQGELVAHLQGGWTESEWHGFLKKMSLNIPGMEPWTLQEPAELHLSLQQLKMSTAVLAGGAGASVRLQGEYAFDRNDHIVDLQWTALSLALFDTWWPDRPVSGLSSGRLQSIQESQEKHISASVQLSADFEHEQLYLQDIESLLTINWGPQGLTGELSLESGPSSKILLKVSSAEPADFSLPQKGEVVVSCRDLPLGFAQPWLPAEITLAGNISCEAEAGWSETDLFAVTGQVLVSEGSVLWYDGEQSIEADLHSVKLMWQWQEDLRAELSILHDFGHLKSALQLPVAAQIPPTLLPNGPVDVNINLLFHENGLLSAFFPQHVYDSQGQIEVNATVGGTVDSPRFVGRISLTDAELYLQATGILIADIALEAVLQDQLLTIEKLQVASGQGSIAGQGTIQLEGWHPQNFALSFRGSQFQLVNLPELMVRISPDLSVEGTLDTLRVRGEVVFPYALIRDQKSTRLVQNSADLVIIDRDLPEKRVRPLRHDVDVQFVLGEQILIDAAGLEAQIEGSLRLYSDMQQNFAAQGRLQVVRGRFSSYGVTLDIERGDLFYAGVPLQQPTFDILALRRAGQVRAGVRVSGTPQEPLVLLYSDPVMPDADILSYIVLGRPLESSGQDTDLLMAAAGALLSQGESIVLQEKMKSRLGLDVLEFSAGEGDMYDSVITTGKYLTPDLYISLGYSLFNNTNEIRIRYRLTPKLEFESNFGQESGVDLFYRLEID